MDAQTQEFLTRRTLEIAQDALREKLIQENPELERDVAIMAQMIRELVNLERAKLGLDRPGGSIELGTNKNKKRESDPHMTGSGRVAGRFYRAAGWLIANEKLQISLLPRKS